MGCAKRRPEEAFTISKIPGRREKTRLQKKTVKIPNRLLCGLGDL